MPIPRVVIDLPVAAPDSADAVTSVPVQVHLSGQPLEMLPTFARACGFRGVAGSVCLLPAADGAPSPIAAALVGLGDGTNPFACGDLARKLPPGLYHLSGAAAQDPVTATSIALAWLLGAYSFDRYRTSDEGGALAQLLWPVAADRPAVEALADAFSLVRDLINTPAADMGPQQLEDAARALAQGYGASLTSIVGEDLLAAGYPAIYAVGCSSPRPPRLLDLRWGDPTAPKVTLVGKGVVFDTGGLDIKPASAMKLMKKDMGGAAHALGVALLVMRHSLSVCLRVLIPVAENAVSGTAMRPGDVVQTRKGLTVEVNNTDAEGRLILADALAEGDSEQPTLLIDFATLTGAARVALGPDLPALLCNDDLLATALLEGGQRSHDPLWRLPLWAGYRSQVESRVADLDNAPEGGMAGAITAGLFLERFVSAQTAWAHIDTYAWTAKPRPGHPQGGNALGMRAVFTVLKDRFG